MAKIFTTEYELTALADAIRARGDTSEPLAFPSGYVQAINNFEKKYINQDLLEETLNKTITSCPTLNLIRVPQNLFRECTQLSHINFPECEIVASNAFNGAVNIKEAIFPKCETIENNAFSNCSILRIVSFPECKTIGDYAFQNCSSLSVAWFPNCLTIGSNAFNNCYNLSTISLPACSYIGTLAFTRCSSLKSVYLMSSSVVTILTSAVFKSSPISTSANGLIYVPGSLIEAYKSASFWSYYSSKFIAGD